MVVPCYSGDKYLTHHNKAERNQAVIREYWIYRTLEATGLPTIKARRAVLNGDMPAFFLEDFDDTAARVGGKNVLTDEERTAQSQRDGYGKNSAMGAILTKGGYDQTQLNGELALYALLTGSRDALIGHNAKVLVRPDKTAHHVAYDFDLSPLVYPGMNVWGDAIRPGAKNFINAFIKSIDKTIIPTLKTVVQNKPAVLQVIEQSDLPEKDKKIFQDWYTEVFKALESRLAQLQ